IHIEGLATQGAILNALELQYPMLRGTIRDQVTKERRPFIRFFACGEDLSLESPDVPLPNAVVMGVEPFRIVGAMAGG
ncbi:MAG: MoaD/ThiS family protein, partial [Chloroflexi bacterium]|nr:MoaD/ThiS family protein [Chloroflexota bacterium]